MKTRVDKRMTRILFAVAAAAAFLMAFGARTAQAAPIAVKSVNYNLTSEEPLVDPEKTENDVKVKITGLLTTDTEGVKIDTSNEFLEYWDSTYKQLNGVGTGSNMVFPLKQYYFCAGTELKPGYDWADEVKALPHMKETPVAQLKTFQVFVNGEVCDKAIICYNSAYNLIRVSFPIGNDLSKAKGELTENTFTYDGKVKDPEVKSLTLGTLEPDEDEYRLRYEDADGKKVWPIDAGTYYAAITGKGMYSGKVRLPFTINKAPNELEIKARTATVKYSAVSLKKQTVTALKLMTFVKKGQGTLKYKLVSAKKGKRSAKKFFSMSSKTGKLTVKKGLAKGTYKVKVTVTALGDENYAESAAKTVTCKVKVK